MAPAEAPEINLEPENCPQAVIEWFNLTSQPNYKRQCKLSRDLSLKAKKHLRYLGWKFWYVHKQGKWELRYTSPITGKNYISLRRACQGCMEEGGCNDNPQNVEENNDQQCPSSSAPKKETKKPSIEEGECNGNPQNVEENNDQHYPSSSAPKKETKKPRKCKKKTRMQPRKRKKRQRDDDGDELGEVSSSIHGRRGAVLPWLIDNNVVGLYSVVFCRGANNVTKKGKLWRRGIVCECCSVFFSLTRFEDHAGCNKHRPSASIFLEDGRSLLDCQKEALSSQQNVSGFMEEEEERDHRGYQNDSICFLCRYGGELVLCDRCPSSFHLSCLGLDLVPDGDWFCSACCCKICKRPRHKEDCADNVDVDSVLICHQCERRYHVGCLKGLGFTGKEIHLDNININWFCSSACEKIFFSLQKLMGKPIRVGGDNLTWTLLKAVKSDNIGESDRTWNEVERSSQKLSVALGVLRECFDPVIDAFFGRDMMAEVVFSRGSELNRLNFRGFYTVVLERDEEVISVATVRIFDKRVAELPFVATRMQFRRLGMCGMLMNEIEKQLTELGVERMVLPSAPNVIDTWINSFGFTRMTRSDKSQFLDYVFLDFEGTTMCHKLLVKQIDTAA
ncbi:Increased DNA methylation 1 [Spatholobus suberectus]|nr:Increased DNA methylation 1 [Spatholobus suberectus]